MMKEENIDSLFKQNLGNLDKLPKDLNWDNQKNWGEYKQTYLKKHSLLRIIGYAASIIILAVALYLYGEDDQVKYTEISTGRGEKTSVKLSNGSVIWLNANTTVRYPEKYVDNEIEIFVEGEAYFEFNEKRENPFIIKAGNTVTSVMESSFNIRAFSTENNIEITVTKGKVEVDSENDEFNEALAFYEGDKASIHKSNKLIFEEENQDMNVLAWKTGNLIFEDEPLYFIVKTLEKLYNVEITLQNNDIKSCTLSFNTQTNSIENVLNKIAGKTNIEIKKDDNGYILYKGSCIKEVKI